MQENREKQQKIMMMYNSPAPVKKENPKEQEDIEFYKNRCNELETVLQHSMKQKTKMKKKPIPGTPNYNDFLFSDDSIADDDVENDPDWTKTPLYSRIQKLMVIYFFNNLTIIIF